MGSVGPQIFDNFASSQRIIKISENTGKNFSREQPKKNKNKGEDLKIGFTFVLIIYFDALWCNLANNFLKKLRTVKESEQQREFVCLNVLIKFVVYCLLFVVVCCYVFWFVLIKRNEFCF